jgi:hypothetical protein
LSIRSTYLKTIFHRFDVDRWPHWKIKSIEWAIENLEQNLVAYNGQRAERIRSQIEKLKKERAEIYRGCATQTNWFKLGIPHFLIVSAMNILTKTFICQRQTTTTILP